MDRPRRDKGLLCRAFFDHGCCLVNDCPSAHISRDFTRPVPQTVCSFFKNPDKVCLRDQCKFFHGSDSALESLLLRGAKTYRPSEYLPLPDVLPPPNTVALGTAQLFIVPSAFFPSHPDPWAPIPPPGYIVNTLARGFDGSIVVVFVVEPSSR